MASKFSDIRPVEKKNAPIASEKCKNDSREINNSNIKFTCSVKFDFNPHPSTLLALSKRGTCGGAESAWTAMSTIAGSADD
jgi:hypothetical protein